MCACQSNQVRGVSETSIDDWTCATTEQVDFNQMHACLIQPLPFLPILREARFTFIDWWQQFNAGDQAVSGRIADFDNRNVDIYWKNNRDGERRRSRSMLTGREGVHRFFNIRIHTANIAFWRNILDDIHS